MTVTGSGNGQLPSEAGAVMGAWPGEQCAARGLALRLDRWRDHARAVGPPN